MKATPHIKARPDTKERRKDVRKKVKVIRATANSSLFAFHFSLKSRIFALRNIKYSKHYGKCSIFISFTESDYCHAGT